MDWPLGPAGQQAANAAGAGNLAAAAGQLASLAVGDALGVCAAVAAGGRTAFKKFNDAYWSSAPPGSQLTRDAFAVRVAESGSVPAGETCGVDALDFQTARQFILRVRDDPPALAGLGWPPDPRGAATTRPFYPDLTRGVNAWRPRICAVAAAHRDKGPGHPQLWALLSLGGFYGLAGARAAARPGSAAAAGVLFARGVLHGAGCNTIPAGAPAAWTAGGGLFGVLPKLPFGYTPASNLELGQRPEAGDVFHIQGVTEDREGRRIDTTHAGVIVGVWGNIWLTVEGGGPGGETRQRTRELVPVSSPHGKWAFKFDEAAAKVGVRPLRGWYSVSKFRADLWMPARPESE